MTDACLPGFQKQQLEEMIELTTPMFKLSYEGPTSKKQVDVESRPKTTSKITNPSFESTSNICVNGNSIQIEGKFQFEKIVGGPYKVSGGDYTGNIGSLLDSFLVLENVSFDVKMQYKFDPNRICRDEVNINPEDISIQIQNVDFEKYYSYEGKDETNIDVDEDLKDLLKQKDSPFYTQYQTYLNPVFTQSPFGKQIIQEVNRVYCEQINIEKIMTAYERYANKLNIIERLGLYFILNRWNN